MALSDSVALLNNSMNTLAQLHSTNVVHDDTEEALKLNQAQFEDTLAEQQRQYNENLDFLKNQHSEQMDFASRNLNANIDIANRNFDLQQEAYEKNLELQNRQFDYQKELNNTQMEREDTAMQRAVADYKAAGFSPLAAIGSPAASSALSSADASSLNPAQYEVGGINTSSGQYADFAKQYSALAYQARQSYSDKRTDLSEKHNADILASRITLAKMRQDMRLGYASLANQVFNSAVNARNARAQYDYIQEQKSYLEDKHKWEEDNGYRGESWQTAAVSAIKEYLNSKSDKGTTIEKAFDVGRQTVEKAQETIDTYLDKAGSQIVQKAKKFGHDVAEVYATAFYNSCEVASKAGKLIISNLSPALKKIYYAGENITRKIKGYLD